MRTTIKDIKISFIAFLIITSILFPCMLRAQQSIVDYVPGQWLPKVWVPEIPKECPFEKSSEFSALAFMGKHASYTDADTWYPSWASNGNMYSGFADGEIGLESTHSSGGAKANTGNAMIEGDDPMNLKVTSLGLQYASALPYQGRYPCANLVYNGIWYYGTYGIDFDPNPENQKYSWAICGPLPGFRISKDYGKTWIPCPYTLDNPLFPESGKNGSFVKMGTPHFVDFGQNMENSPDGYAYLVGDGGADDDPHPRAANNSWIAGDAVYMARVKPSPETINNLSDYEFFAGYDSKGEPVWSHNFSDIKPVMEWMHHMGCTTITYNKPLQKYFMCVTDGWPGIENMNSYILESDYITGPYKIITYMKDFGSQGYFMTIPSKFIAPDGKTFWLSYSANFSRHYFGDISKANPVGSRYAWNLQLVQFVNKSEEAADLSKMKEEEPDPIKSKKNIALRANIVVSSALRSAKPMTELHQYFGEGAIDGVVDTASAYKINEWVSDGETNTAFIRLNWKEPQKISKVWLFDRPDLKNQITSGMLVFSDGSTIRVSALPNDAHAARQIKFPEKEVTWLAFVVDKVSATTTDAGLAEIAVFK
ncbi:MAG TPA: hypothetical protein VG847_10220 [Chitinophagaceae bacterium]|nr:hypothetical protein [Chitinophagaceae bacterium]